MSNFDSAIKEHPLPWSVKLIGRDTPRGVCEIRDAEGHYVGSTVHAGEAAIYPQQLAKLIVWSVNSLAEVGRTLEIGDVLGGSELQLNHIMKILRGE